MSMLRKAGATALSTTSIGGLWVPAMTVSQRPRPSSKQRPMIAEDHAGGVVAGGAGDAAAGMRAASAMIEAFQRPAIIGVAEHRPRREQLIEGQRAVKNIAAEQAELALQIERREDLPADHACRKTRRITIHGRDHEIGDLIAMVIPGPALGQFRRDVLAEQAGDMLARRAQRIVERRGDQQLDHTLAAPAMRPRGLPGAVHIAEAPTDDDAR